MKFGIFYELQLPRPAAHSFECAAGQRLAGGSGSIVDEQFDLPAEAKASSIHLFSMQGRLGLFSKVLNPSPKSRESQAHQQIRDQERGSPAYTVYFSPPNGRSMPTKWPCEKSYHLHF
jgi:hypothetical protein